jgi:hypothetical protein
MNKKHRIFASFAVISALAAMGLYIAFKSQTNPKPSSVRGVNRAMVIFSADNTTYLPGLNNSPPAQTQPSP